MYRGTGQKAVVFVQEQMELVSPTPQCLEAEADKLKMRRWVVTNILDSERAYMSTLDVLLQVLYRPYYC